MIRRSRCGMLAALAVAWLGGGCRVQLQPPDTAFIRMIEPRLVEPGGVSALRNGASSELPISPPRNK